MLPEVVSYPEGQRIWLVRASGGKHFQNFLKHGVVAISHIDKLIGLSVDKKIPAPEVIREFLYAEAKLAVTPTVESINVWLDGHGSTIEASLDEEASDEDLSDDPENKMSAANRESQVNKFITEIGVGDLVVTINSSHIAIGFCVSDAYVDETVLINRIDRGRNPPKIEVLDYKLRRGISWGRPIERELVSASLRKPLLARNTVSCLDEHWDKVYTLAYPFFIRDNTIYFSNRIDKQGPIGTRSMCALLDSIVCAQLVADAIFTGLAPGRSIKDLLDNDCYELGVEERLMSQAEVMSPGYLHHKIKGLLGVNPEKYTAILILLLSIGLSGCDADTQGLIEKANSLVSSLQQNDMSMERNATVDGTLATDKMLQEYLVLTKPKNAGKVARTLKVGPGNAVGALPAKAPAVSRRAIDNKLDHPKVAEKVADQAVQFNLDLK